MTVPGQLRRIRPALPAVSATLLAAATLACSDLFGGARPDFAFRAETRLLAGLPDTVETIVVVTNTTLFPVEFGIGGCGPTAGMEVYDDPAREGPSIWSYDEFRGVFGCIALDYSPVVLPGDSVVFVARATVPQILGDSLPVGRYYFAGSVRLYHPDIDSGELPTGSLVLSGSAAE